MKRLISVIIFAILTALFIFGGFSANAEAPYREASSWAVPELDKAVEYGFITNKIKNKMNTPVTREEFAEIAVKLYEKCTGKSVRYFDAGVFTDTGNPEVFKAYYLKIVNGTDAGRKLFSPDQSISREQVAAMIFRTIKAIGDSDFSGGEPGEFSDEKDVSDWALEPVRFMTANGFLRGEGGKLNPKGTCTGEMAVIIAVRVYEKYSQVAGSGDLYNWDQIVINDTEIFRDNYYIKEKGGFYYIFIEAERFKYAFKLPFAGSHTYPETDIYGGSISICWNDGEKEFLRVDLREGNTEALVAGKKLDAGMAPYMENGKMYIPINLFISAMDMDVETSSNEKILYVQYKNTFSRGDLEGEWSDTSIDLFAGFKDVKKAGPTALPPYATAYRFNDNGTYELRMASANGYNDRFIAQWGKYRIMGNTIVFYDILETAYKGVPLELMYENKSLGRPQYSFIYNYDPKRDRIEIGGFWYDRRRL